MKPYKSVYKERRWNITQEIKDAEKQVKFFQRQSDQELAIYWKQYADILKFYDKTWDIDRIELTADKSPNEGARDAAYHILDMEKG